MRVRLITVVTSSLLILGLLVGTSAAEAPTGWDTFKAEKTVEVSGDTETTFDETEVAPTAIRVIAIKRGDHPQIRLNWTLTCTNADGTRAESGSFVLQKDTLKKKKNLGVPWVADFDSCNLVVTSNKGKVKFKLQAKYTDAAEAVLPTITSSSQWSLHLTPMFESGVSCTSDPKPSHCDDALTAGFDVRFNIDAGVVTVNGSTSVSALEKDLVMSGIFDGEGKSYDLTATILSGGGVLSSTITFNTPIAATDRSNHVNPATLSEDCRTISGTYVHQYANTTWDISGEFTLSLVTIGSEPSLGLAGGCEAPASTS